MMRELGPLFTARRLRPPAGAASRGAASPGGSASRRHGRVTEPARRVVADEALDRRARGFNAWLRVLRAVVAERGPSLPRLAVERLEAWLSGLDRVRDLEIIPEPRIRAKVETVLGNIVTEILEVKHGR